MKYDDIFISKEIPNKLSKQETQILFTKMKQGNMTAREELINHNIRLVMYSIKNKFIYFNCDKNELVTLGCIALIKAVDTYDISKKIEFSTYAVRCINNEILDYLNLLEKERNILNFTDIFCIASAIDEEDWDIKLENNIPSEENMEEEYIEKINNNLQLKLLKQSMKYLNEYEKKIVMLYFGFYNNKKYSCRELASMMNVSRTQISKIVRKSLSKLKEKMEELNNLDNTLKKSKVNTVIK